MATLAECQLLAGLGPEDLAILTGVATALPLEAGEQLFHLGDPADRVYLVERGTIALTLPMSIRGEEREVAIGQQSAGATVGWSALVPPHRRTLGARAATSARLWSLDRASLEGAFAQHPAIELVLFRNLCGVISARLALMEAMLLRDLQKWVAEAC